MRCKKCDSKYIVKNGKVGAQQQYLCRSCGHQFINEFERCRDWEQE